jgi:HEAT repeat protein
LEDPDAEVRGGVYSAVNRLYREGFRPMPPLPASEQGQIRRYFEQIHARAVASTRQAVPAGLAKALDGPTRRLFRELGGEDERERRAAADALMKVNGEVAEAFFPDILARAGDPAPLTRRVMAAMLGRLTEGIDAPGSGRRALIERATPVLVSELGDGDPDVRATAAGALGKIGQAHRPALDALRECLGSADPELRGAAVVALSSPEPELGTAPGGPLRDALREAARSLIPTLENGGPRARRSAALSLGYAEEDLAAQAVPGLCSLLLDGETKDIAARSLIHLHQRSSQESGPLIDALRAALPRLCALAGEDDPAIRRLLLQVLRRHGSQRREWDPDTIEAVRRMVDAEVPGLRIRAKKLLDNMVSPPAPSP